MRAMICLFCVLFPMFVFSEDQTQNVKAKPVLVTVSALAIPAASVSASVTVITREEIEANHSENVLDLLQSAPFVHISQVGGSGGLATVTLRGGDPNFTLVMVDGIPVNDPTNLLGGSYDFSTMSTDQIERIEIVRGPLSSVYGSEAISGVINIISRQGSGPAQFSMDARAGNFGSQDLRAGVHGEHSIWKYAVSGSYYDIDEQTENDTQTRKTFAFRSSADLSSTQTLQFTGRFTNNEASGFPPNGGGPLFSILRDSELKNSKEYVFGADYSHPKFGLNFDYFHHLNDSFTPAILDQVPPTFSSLPSFENHSDFDRTRIQGTGFWKRGPISASVSAGWKRESGSSQGVIAEVVPSEFKLTRNTYSAGGEIFYHYGPVDASFGIRVDDPDSFSSEVSPRIGFSYLWSQSKTRFRSTWGKGYKLPSFLALGDPNIGNPDLLPERSRGWDLGVEQELRNSRMSLSAVYFDNTFRDLIDFSAESFRLVNRNRVVTNGIEMEGRYDVSKAFRLLGQVNYVNSDIRDSDEPLRDRPKWRGGVGLDWHTTPNSLLYIRYTAIGDRFDFQVPVPERTIAEGYQTLDAAFSYKFSGNITAFVRADNLLDREYQEFIGFSNPGIFVRAGVAINFQP